MYEIHLPLQLFWTLKLTLLNYRQTLDLLDSASKGNQEHEDQIKKTLSDAKSLKNTYAAFQRQTNKPKPPKPLSQRDIRKQEAIRHEEETQQRKPNTSSILSRPHMGVRDRKVPVLVNARGIPFLRLKKPQPKNLSGVIRAKLEKRWNRIVLRDRLQVDLLFAEDEEAWDKLTAVSPKDRSSWTQDVKSALNDVCARIVETDRDNRDLSEKMWNIVLQERELVSKEKHNREQVNRLQ